MSVSTNWEDVYRVQTARIAELERENVAIKAHADRVGDANDKLIAENDFLRLQIDHLIDANKRIADIYADTLDSVLKDKEARP